MNRDISQNATQSTFACHQVCYLPNYRCLMSINAQQNLLASVRVGTVNSPRPFFKRGAYTESDSAPARKYDIDVFLSKQWMNTMCVFHLSVTQP